MSLLLYVVILVFKLIADDSVVSSLFKAAGYTYGPLLGLYAFGLMHKKQVVDKWIPYLCLLCPILTYLLNIYSEEIFNGYQFGFEIIILNGCLTYFGLHLISKNHLNLNSQNISR